MTTCPHCGHALEEPTLIERLRAAARERGFIVSIDDAVDEAAAAALLDRASSTLTNWRAQTTGPTYRKRGGRVYYPLVALADWIERDDFH